MTRFQSFVMQLTALLCLLVVGTTWDKDFRICLVLSSLKVDNIYEKGSEFYVPDEQVNDFN